MADVVGDVTLVEPAAGFVEQCGLAAATLEFPVPCTTRLPQVASRGRHCCTAGVDATAARNVFLSIAGFHDDGRSPDKLRHLVVEAREARDAPPSPCYAGIPAGTLAVAGQEITVLECPPSTPEAEANIRHGEGAHLSTSSAIGIATGFATR